MASQPGAIRRAWYKWKMLDLPWRKQRLIGFDLTGNTFWEFHTPLSTRPRRIVKYPSDTHYGDVKVPPSWMQWLRHTRRSAPTLSEQRQDVQRQAAMKQLAARADERWASKPSMLDPPSRNQPVPAPGIRDPGGYMGQTEEEGREGVRRGDATVGEIEGVKRGENVDKGRFRGEETRENGYDPWKTAQKGAPGEDWQPKAWTPDSARRR